MIKVPVVTVVAGFFGPSLAAIPVPLIGAGATDCGGASVTGGGGVSGASPETGVSVLGRSASGTPGFVGSFVML